MKKDTEKPKSNEKPESKKALKGFDLSINEFGEINSNLDINEINAFLNEHTDDKKLRSNSNLKERKNESDQP